MQTMLADFPDETFDAYMRGDVVDNNGLRSRKGSFYPKQPTFRPKPTAKETFQDLGVELAAYGTSYLVKNIICPTAKRFFDRNIYPIIEEKWNDLKLLRTAVKIKRMEAQAPAQPETQAQVEEDAERSAVVLNLEDYRKMA